MVNERNGELRKLRIDVSSADLSNASRCRHQYKQEEQIG